MEPLVAANIVNLTLGVATGAYMLWFVGRRPERRAAAWAAVISLSAAIYAATMIALYLLGPSPWARPATQILYLDVVVLVHAVPTFAAALNERPIPHWRLVAPISMLVWSTFVVATPWVVAREYIEIEVWLSPRSFALPGHTILAAVFRVYALAVAGFGVYWLGKKRVTPMHRLFVWGFALWVAAGVFDSLVIMGIMGSCPTFLSEYGILMISLALFAGGQQEHIGLLDSQRKELTESRASLHTLIEQSPELVAVHRDGRFVYVNEAGSRFLGYTSSDELVGVDVMSVVDPRDHAAVLERLGRAEGTGEGAAPVRERLIRKDGETVVAEIRSIPVVFEDYRSFMVFGRDASERARLEAHMMEMDRMVAIGTLAAGVAHEINNPLTFVMTNIDLIADAISSLEDRRAAGLADVELVEVIEGLRQSALDAREGSVRIRNTVRDLSGLARSSVPEAVPVELIPIIESAARLTANQLKHRAQLVLEFEDSPVVVADGGRLGQVFINLLINAVQAMSVGDATRNTIRVRTERHGDSTVVTVSDTGSGIPPELVDRIFDPFVTSKGIGEGTGLGLAISRQIVVDHGGTLEVQSVLGRGTTFILTLPRPPARAPRRRSARRSSRGGEPGAPRGRVLLIDDEEIVVRALTRVLKPRHDVEGVRSAAEAVDRLEAGQRCDAILCDLMMPQMSGMEFSALLERRWPDLRPRLRFITGGVFSEEGRAFVAALSSPVFCKPLEMSAVLAFIEEQVARPPASPPSTEPMDGTAADDAGVDSLASDP